MEVIIGIDHWTDCRVCFAGNHSFNFPTIGIPVSSKLSGGNQKAEPYRPKIVPSIFQTAFFSQCKSHAFWMSCTSEHDPDTGQFSHATACGCSVCILRPCWCRQWSEHYHMPTYATQLALRIVRVSSALQGKTYDEKKWNNQWEITIDIHNPIIMLWIFQ